MSKNNISALRDRIKATDHFVDVLLRHIHPFQAASAAEEWELIRETGGHLSSKAKASAGNSNEQPPSAEAA